MLNVVRLMTVAYNLELRAPFVFNNKLLPQSVPENPFTVDADTIERIRRRCWCQCNLATDIAVLLVEIATDLDMDVDAINQRPTNPVPIFCD